MTCPICGHELLECGERDDGKTMNLICPKHGASAPPEFWADVKKLADYADSNDDHTEGYDDGYTKGYNDGRKDEYDEQH